MMHPDQMYQLRQLRNPELLIETRQARIIQECVRDQSLHESTGIGMTSIRKNIRLGLMLLILSLLCLALAAATIRPISAWVSGTETGAHRFIATRLALLTSPNPDPRQPTNPMRIRSVALDQTVGEYISRL
jgi:hypothetical protein